MAKKLSFKDFMVVDYRPGEPEEIKYKDLRQRRTAIGGESVSEKEKKKKPYQHTEEVKAVDEVSQALGHKVAKARQSQASALRQKAVDEPDMMKAFGHTKAANKAERKAGQSYNRLMKKEEVELDEYNTKSSKVIVTKDNKPVAIYSDLKAAQKDYYGKDGYAIGARSASAAMRIKKENPGIKIVESVEDDVDEALNVTQRLAKSRQMKRMKAKLSLGRKRAAKRIASQEKLMMRSRRKAREFILKRLTKDIPKSELTFARRQELEKRLDKMKGRIEKIAKRMLPKVRKAELDKKRGGGKKD
jgi:hypothetical protein